MDDEPKQASAQQIKRAREAWQTDEIEIDDNAKATKAGDGGNGFRPGFICNHRSPTNERSPEPRHTRRQPAPAGTMAPHRRPKPSTPQRRSNAPARRGNARPRGTSRPTRPAAGANNMKPCRNAEPSNYGHECGKPAQWTGTNREGYRAAFCDQCKQQGHEARYFTQWTKEPTA